MALRDQVKKYDKKYGSAGFYKLEEGQNQIRFLTEPQFYDSEYQGSAEGAFVAYVIVRDPENEDHIALFDNISKTVIRWLADQEDTGKFAGYPMPMDVMIFKQVTGKKSTYVAVLVEDVNSPALTSAQQDTLLKLPPIVEVAEKMSRKKVANLKPAGIGPADVVQAALKPAPDSVQQKRNSAEMNLMFTALEKAIDSAADVDKLAKAVEMAKSCLTAGSINDFEADLLKDKIKARQEQLKNSVASTDAAAGLDDVKVDDIPF